MGVANVSAAKPKVGGAASWAQLGSSLSLPTDATSTLTGFTGLGYISDAGLTNSNSPESQKIKAWGGDYVLTTSSGKTDTYTFTLLEVLDENVLKVPYGDANVSTATGKTTVKHNAKDLEAHAWVFDMIMRGGKLKRIVLPSATVEAVGDITYVDGSAVGYQITLNAEPDASGNTAYEYIQAPPTGSST